MTEDRDPLRAIVENAVASGRTPGAAWCVAGPAGILSRGVAGDACVDPAREPADETTPYDLASLTKPLATALLCVLLEREGRLDLDAPASAIVPELAGSAYGHASLLDFGAHRAGLPAWRPLFAAGTTREAYLAAVAREAPERPAGEAFYSDLGYVVLGIAAERAAASELDALFDERVAKRLGLRLTGFPGTGTRFARAAATERGNVFERAMAGDAAAGYPFRTEVIRGHVHDANAWGIGGVAGHAGLFGTAEEVAFLGRAILEGLGGTRMLLPVAGTGSRTFGLTPAEDSDTLRGVLPADALGHFGFTGTSMWLEPATGRVHVLLTNRIHPVVPAEDFSATRREFHAAASSLPDLRA